MINDFNTIALNQLAARLGSLPAANVEEALRALHLCRDGIITVEECWRTMVRLSE